MKKFLLSMILLGYHTSHVSARHTLVSNKFNDDEGGTYPRSSGHSRNASKSIRSRRNMESYRLNGKGYTQPTKGKGYTNAPVTGKGYTKGKGYTSVPVNSPVNIFDLSNCSAYSTTWILDLHESCMGNPLTNDFKGCLCDDAQRRIARGEIVCGRDMCPDDCEVCKTCLYYVIEDCLDIETNPPNKAPSIKPSTRQINEPSTPTPSTQPTYTPSIKPTARQTNELSSILTISKPSTQPIQASFIIPTTRQPNTATIPEPTTVPTILFKSELSKNPSQEPSDTLPTPKPTLSPTEDPFNLEICSTYSNTWLLDLRGSCAEIDGDLTDCRCADVERRIKNGQIKCGFDLCPDDCEVCKVCLYYVVGCEALNT